MSKAKFIAARELINEKQYDEARSILKTIDHPTATEWLRKLDEIAPHKPNTDIHPQKTWLRTVKTSTTQVDSNNPSRRNLLKIGVVAGASTLIVAIAILILIPKITNRGADTPNSESSQSTAQIDALVTYCMKYTDSSSNKCTTTAQSLLSDKELSPIIADCIANFAPESDSFNQCIKDTDKIIFDRLDAVDNQKVALYWLCSGSHITTDSGDTESDPLYIFLNEQRSGEAVRDEDCRNWMVKLDQLYPTAQAINDCVGTRSEYFELFGGTVARISLEGFDSNLWGSDIRNNFINVVNCMVTHLGDKFPPLPACTADYPHRTTCTNPLAKPT